MRELIVNSAAGGIALSLQDLDGNFPRGGLASPSFSAVEMIQLFGRLCRDGGKSKSFYRVVLADKTVETKVWRAFQTKQGNIRALNDGDLNPYNYGQE
jgi:hypothetical protein